MLRRATGAATAKCQSRSASLFVSLGADGRPPVTRLLQGGAEFTILAYTRKGKCRGSNKQDGLESQEISQKAHEERRRCPRPRSDRPASPPPPHRARGRFPRVR